MPKDVYLQPDAPDPVLAEDVVLRLTRQFVATVQAVTGTVNLPNPLEHVVSSAA